MATPRTGTPVPAAPHTTRSAAITPAPNPATTATAAPPPTAPPDLRVKVWPEGMAHYYGPAAALQAEPGLIPPGTTWPAKGTQAVTWQANGVSFSLRRCRPQPHTGQRHTWQTADHWCLDMRPANLGTDTYGKRRIALLTQELQAALHAATTQGQAQAAAMWQRYWQAQHDKAFQAFKAQAIAANTHTSHPPQRIFALGTHDHTTTPTANRTK